MRVFSHALRHVPKSGEVWAEGARLHMNPCSPYYDTVEAGRCLMFGLQVCACAAVGLKRTCDRRPPMRMLVLQFTPQYGDSFVEWLRLCLLVAAGFGTHDEALLHDDAVRTATCCSAKGTSTEATFRNLEEVVDLSLEELLATVDTSLVEQKYACCDERANWLLVTMLNTCLFVLLYRCMNADPNYGSMWFHCKTRPFDTARQVCKSRNGAYIAAYLRSMGVFADLEAR